MQTPIFAKTSAWGLAGEATEARLNASSSLKPSCIRPAKTMSWHRRPEVIAAESLKLGGSLPGSRELPPAKPGGAAQGGAAGSPKLTPTEATAAEVSSSETAAAEMSSSETAATESASVPLTGRAKDKRADCDATGRDYGKRPDHLCLHKRDGCIGKTAPEHWFLKDGD